MDRKNRSFISTGISTILMVFVSMCLITFAVLSLASANADYRFSERTAKRTEEYYQAENRANDRIKEIDELLLEQYNNSKSRWEYETGVKKALEKIEDISFQESSQGIGISFSEKIDEEETLEVELRAAYSGKGFCQVESWQSVHRTQWSGDSTLPVLQK